MVEFFIDTNETKVVSTDVGFYLRKHQTKDYYYVRLPIDIIWSRIHNSSLIKLKVSDDEYKQFRLYRFDISKNKIKHDKKS